MVFQSNKTYSFGSPWARSFTGHCTCGFPFGKGSTNGGISASIKPDLLLCYANLWSIPLWSIWSLSSDSVIEIKQWLSEIWSYILLSNIIYILSTLTYERLWCDLQPQGPWAPPILGASRSRGWYLLNFPSDPRRRRWAKRPLKSSSSWCHDVMMSCQYADLD